MKWLIDNWSLLVVLIAFVICIYLAIRKFASLPSIEQQNKIKQWLLYAVLMAEKELGGGTGQMKLRYVYNMFLEKFPSLVPIVSFELFAHWVDEVLVQMRHLLEENKDIESYVKGD